MSYHLGDFALETSIYAKFTTVTTTGAPTQLAGSPVVSVYENDDNTQITAGVTLNVDEDGITGLNQLVIAATAANGYEAGKFYTAIITTGTVGGTSVVGYCVASFTIQAVSALRPTTAGRTLDVTAGGEAGIDWANIGSPTTAQNLSGTNIDTDQVVASVTGAVGSVGGNVGGNVAGSVGSVTARVTANTDQLAGQTVTAGAGVTFPTSVASPTNITAGTITTVTNLTNAPTNGDFTATMKTSIGTAVAASAVASVTGNVGGNVNGNVVGSVGSVSGNVGGNVAGDVQGNVDGTVAEVLALGVGSIPATAFDAGAIDATALNTTAVAEIWAQAIAELSQAKPSATPTVLNAIAMLYMIARNEIAVTSSEKTFTNDAGVVVFKKALTDNGTTYTEDEMEAGP